MSDPIENFNFVEGVNIDDSMFSASELLSAQEIVRGYLSDRFRHLDLSGASGLNDTVIRPTSRMFALTRKIIDEFSRTRTLRDAIENNGKSSVIDGILSNFFVERRAGSKSTGTVKIDVENFENNQSIFQSQEFFTSSGLKFYPVKNYFASSSPNRQRDVEIFKSSFGNAGYFFIDVVAEMEGEAYNISKDTPLEYAGGIDGKISCTAVSSFKGGQNQESNESLYNRVFASLSARNMTSPIAIDKAIRSRFPETIHTTTHGVSSKYMTRNSHNPFKIKSGCFCDVYIKNSSSVTEKEISVVASKINDEDSEFNGLYVATIGPADFPGHYDVTGVYPISNNKIIGSFEIVSKRRDFIGAGGSAQNEIYTISEASFSSYSVTRVYFKVSEADEDDLNPQNLSEVSVICRVIGQVGIAEIQEYVNEGSNQSSLIDTLIKSCVPCFVSIGPINVSVDQSSSISASDVVSVVNDYIVELNPSKGQIRSDVIVSRISSLDGVRSIDLPIRINASIISAGETIERVDITSISSLVIPSIPKSYIAPETVGFFVEPGSISVNLSKN